MINYFKVVVGLNSGFEMKVELFRLRKR